VLRSGGVNVSATASRIYRAIRCNATAVAKIRAEYASLALALATEADASFELTSFTLNGQTGSGKRDSTNDDRLALLDQVIWCLDNNYQVPRTTRISF